jgi:hypothetical protein
VVAKPPIVFVFIFVFIGESKNLNIEFLHNTIRNTSAVFIDVLTLPTTKFDVASTVLHILKESIKGVLSLFL